MRYSILGFNQKLVNELSLDLTDLAILQYIADASASPKMQKLKENETDLVYVWISHKHLLEDLPILHIKDSMLNKRIKHLIDLELLDSKVVANNKSRGSKAYYAITEKCVDLKYAREDTNDMTNCNRLHEVNRPTVIDYTRSQRPTVMNYTSNSSTNKQDTTITINNKEFIEKGNEIIELYNDICVNLPKVTKFTDKRKKGIQALLKKGYTIDDFRNVFLMANGSDFLIGKNDRGWNADLDFLLREDKFVKTLEGGYGGHKKSRDGLRGTTDSHERKAEIKRRIANGTLERI